VFVSFIIEKDGSISNIQILKSPSNALSSEVIRLIKSMPAWTPAKHQGEVVRSKFSVPVKFVLP
jgi:TonB family protein